jgi:hypothetical protein
MCQPSASNAMELKNHATGNFRHHHHGGQPHGQARLALGAQVAGMELVAVLPAV